MGKRLSLSPLTIGKHTLENRVVLPAHAYNFPSGEEGEYDLCEYLRLRLENSVSLAIIGEAEVMPPKFLEGMPCAGRVAGEASASLYRKIADLISDTGKLIVEQVFHPGGQVWFEEQRAAFAPSSILHPRSYTLPVVITQDQISQLVSSYVETAACIAEKGLSGIELKADQGKLLHQFLSRRYNRRADDYGGSFANRSRLILEILSEIRSRCPEKFIVGIRLSGEVSPFPSNEDGEFISDVSISETLQLVDAIEALDLADYVSISGETNSTVYGYYRNHGDLGVARQTFGDIGKALKARTSKPVLLAGRFLTLADADYAIEQGHCDAVGMVRALIAEPRLVLLSENNPEEVPVRPCIQCNICVGNVWYGGRISCAINPESGLERASRPGVPSDKKYKNILVVGGGPAGLQYAYAISKRGAKVTLVEQSDKLGGQLLTWSQLPNCSEISSISAYWESRIRRDRRVEILLRTDGRSISNLEDFDRIAWAAGSTVALPESIPEGGPAILTPEDALRREAWSERKVVLVDGDRFQDPLGIAWWIALRGAKVTVVTPYDMVAVALNPVSRAARIAALRKMHVTFRTWCDVEISSRTGSLYVHDHCTNELHPVEADDIVWCVNRHPIILPEYFTTASVVSIGDSVWPRGLEVTVKESFRAAS